ncbi:hypothetical protein ACOMHN_061753 [Nucella lapillus]
MATTKRYLFGMCCLFAVIYLVESGIDKKMTQSVRCPGLVLSPQYRSQAMEVRSLLECLTYCSPREDCRSIVFDADTSLCYLADLGSEKDCSNMEATARNLRFYEMAHSDSGSEEMSTDTSTQSVQPSSTLRKDTEPSAYAETNVTTTSPCQNGGWLDENGTCICVSSHVGTYCERYMRDCEEGMFSGFYSINGQYIIQPSLSPAPFPVYCQFIRAPPNTSRNYIFTRNDVNFTFNRTWMDFRLGFGDVSTDHWLGLDKLYQLTNSKTFELRIRVKVNETAIRSYFRNFVVGDEASSYKLSVGLNYKQEVEDCMSVLQGAKFSTYDADNDGNADTNCAAVFGGGWWYTGANCSACNPLGPVPADNGSRVGEVGEIFWSGFGGSYPFPIRVYLVTQE